MKQATMVVLLAVTFTCLGLASGWFAAQQKSPAGGHGHAPAPEAGHEGHAHGPAAPKLSPQAVKNLGLVVAEAVKTTYWLRQDVPAVVAEAPDGVQPLFAPIGGRIAEIRAQPGAVVATGAVVLTLLRDALPRPVLTLTEQVLNPANEDFHRTVSELRKSRRELDLLKSELERIRTFAESGTQDGLPILPRKNLIDLRYDIARSEMDLQNAENELRRHGAIDEQIRDLAAGKNTPMLGQQIWKQALQQNGLWTPQAEALFVALPREIQNLPWAIAALGELTAAGVALADLTAWVKAAPETAKHFLEIAGLLQQGQSLAAVQAMHATNALEQVVRIVVPAAQGAPDWDLVALDVKLGQKVEAGQKVATLTNPRRLLLRAEPVGGETAALLKVLEHDASVDARPLLAGTGPDLKGLKLAGLTSDADGHGTVAVLSADNEPLAMRDHPRTGKTRTWKLRVGLRYVLEAPTEKLDDVFVLPAGAVTDDGPDKVVFIQNGESFMPVKVVVRYQDHRVAVLDGKLSDLAVDDSVVTQGAYGLSLALKAGTNAIDPHAGHQH